VAAGPALTVPLAAKVAFLEQPGSYPEPTTEVRAIETHMSWVFLTDERVYKMKKPVRLPFLDFSTLARRRRCCEESLRLNRRLAASVYLGVVPLTLRHDGRLRIGGCGQAVEWLEKMRRVPEERMLDVAIRRGTVTDQDVRRFVAVLAQFYRSAPPVRFPPVEFRARLLATILANERALGNAAFGLSRSRLARIAGGQRRFIDRESSLFDQRLAAGRIIEAHGDLRPEHVCLEDEPVFIDCLEFNRDFRVMDVADELSYLAMECELAGAAFVGPVLFETYERKTGDYIPSSLIAFYKSFRAVVRAKVAAWHLPDYPPETHRKWLGQAAAYLQIAERQLGQQV
jgi:aminoglycoside phosphotransferase family enzyme